MIKLTLFTFYATDLGFGLTSRLISFTSHLFYFHVLPLDLRSLKIKFRDDILQLICKIDLFLYSLLYLRLFSFSCILVISKPYCLMTFFLIFLKRFLSWYSDSRSNRRLLIYFCPQFAVRNPHLLSLIILFVPLSYHLFVVIRQLVSE